MAASTPIPSLDPETQRPRAQPTTDSTPDFASIASPKSSRSSDTSSRWRNIYAILTYTPRRCRWDAENPPRFSMSLNFLFAFAACFTVANLYYNHPILNKLAEDFNISYERASLIPTMMQAGYAIGLVFLCPLGDLFRRRAFVLILVWFTATIWVGLCLTTSFPLFCLLSLLTSITTVTPQLMLPLVGDLAPPHRRATSLSIVVSGVLLGMLIARVLSGILTQYTHWRTIYWLSFGLQYLILILLWLFMPDYPSTNPTGLTYPQILISIPKILFTEPVLAQACLVGFSASAPFMTYWTTLTFLLASPPYVYPPLIIGLFALIGIASMFLGPPYSRLVIDRFVPLFSVILGLCFCLVGIIIGTYTGTFTIAGPVIQAFAIDLGLQTSQIANRSAIYAIMPKARNRVNTAYMASVFCGQLVGTAVGNHVYASGGWVASGSVSVGFVVFGLVVCGARGPWEKGWVGWRGGWGLRRRDLGRKGRSEKDTEGREGEPRMGGVGDEIGGLGSIDEKVVGGTVVEGGVVHRKV